LASRLPSARTVALSVVRFVPTLKGMDDRRRLLRRVRNIAAASAALESLKLLPALDPIVLAVEWVGLKTIVPSLLELKDAWRDKRLSAKAVLAAPLSGNWISLLYRAFGSGTGLGALLADTGTDGMGLLPTPIDGFDVPPMLADAAIALLAQRELRLLDGEEDQSLTPPPVSSVALQ
jgi:hypothetical protein